MKFILKFLSLMELKQARVYFFFVETVNWNTVRCSVRTFWLCNPGRDVKILSMENSNIILFAEHCWRRNFSVETCCLTFFSG